MKKIYLALILSLLPLHLAAQANAVKLTFLSLVTGSTKLSYERALPKLNQSAELSGSFIGIGFDSFHNNPVGLTVRYGHKFFLGHNRDVVNHPLRGAYLRPEVIWSNYKYDSAATGVRSLSNMGSLLGCAGIQWDWGHFLLDGWVGAGTAFGQYADTYYEHGFALLNLFGHFYRHIAVSFTIKVGYCF